jgi:predicted RNase H-like HicB family nuclease
MFKELLLTALMKKEEGGYSVLCPELDVASQGDTMDECVINIREAVELYLESAVQMGMMDEVLDQLGISKEAFLKDILLPQWTTMSLPVEVAV